MKKTIITTLLTLTVGAFLTTGCPGEGEPDEPTAADEAEAGQVAPPPEGADPTVDPSNEDSNKQGSPNPNK